jgi:hypothetical protein
MLITGYWKKRSVINKLISYSYAKLCLLVGSGLKLGPIATIDEVGLAFIAIRETISRNFEIRIGIEGIVYSYFIFMALIGFLTSFSLNSFRLLPLLFSLLLIRNWRAIKVMDLYGIILYRIIIGYMSFLLIIPFAALFVAGLEVAWWQDWLLTGTAYANFSAYLCALIVIQRSDTPFIVKILSPAIIFGIAIATDSRATVFFAGLSMIHLITKDTRRWLLVSIGLFIPIALMVTLLPRHDLLEYGINVGVADALVNAVVEDNESDEGRKRQNKSMLRYIELSPWQSIFGGGAYSHQTSMLNYGVPADTTGIVRPTGLPVVLFDYGILGMVFLVLLCVRSSGILIKYGENLPEAIYLCIVPFVALLYLGITNLLDMVLFWMVINGSIGHAFLVKK